MSPKLAWLGLFLVLWLVALLSVPRARLVDLLLPSFLLGTVAALLVNLVGSSLLGLWRFPVALVPVFGVPLFLLLAYMPEMLLFLHYWDYLPGGSTERFVYILAFSLANTAVAHLAATFKYLVFVRWNLLLFFLLSFFIHGLAVLLSSFLGARAGLERS